MRCAAPVSERHRSRAWNQGDRCSRASGLVRVGGKWFCYQHAPVWRKHYAIVARIRAL